MNNPLVSVIIPTFNRADEIVEAIWSVRQQSYDNLEIIVVDDASVDETPLRVEVLQDENLRYFRHDFNQGAAASRNTGIQAASGDLIAFLDSDDRWKPSKISRQLEVFEQSDERPGLVYCGTELMNPTPRASGIRPSAKGDIYRRQLERDRIAGTPTWLVRGEVFDRVGGFNEGLTARNDYEMSLRISEHYTVDYVDERLVEVGVDQSNRITKDIESRIESHLKIIEEVVRPRIQEFSTSVQDEVLGIQYFSLARFCQRRGDHEDAREYFQQSLEHYPLNPKGWLAMGFASLDLDLPDTYYSLMNSF